MLIGDRLTTDMPFGRINNMRTLFVETGVHNYEDMINFANSKEPKDQLLVPYYYLKASNHMNKYL